jgi:hypothetical protein
MKAALVALPALAAAACSSDIDLAGVYSVDTDVASMPCGADTAVSPVPAFIKFDQVEFFGQTSWKFEDCSDGSGTMCSGDGAGLFGGTTLVSDGLFTGLTTPVKNGWTGTEYTSSFSGTMCTLDYKTTSATVNGPKLAVDVLDYKDTITSTNAECTTDVAKQRNSSMPCVAHGHIAGTKL